MARKKRRVERLRKQQKAKIDSINNDEDMPDSAKLRCDPKDHERKGLETSRKGICGWEEGRESKKRS